MCRKLADNMSDQEGGHEEEQLDDQQPEEEEEQPHLYEEDEVDYDDDEGTHTARHAVTEEGGEDYQDKEEPMPEDGAGDQVKFFCPAA